MTDYVFHFEMFILEYFRTTLENARITSQNIIFSDVKNKILEKYDQIEEVTFAFQMELAIYHFYFCDYLFNFFTGVFYECITSEFQSDLEIMILVRHAPFISNCYAYGIVRQNASWFAFENMRKNKDIYLQIF